MDDWREELRKRFPNGVSAYHWWESAEDIDEPCKYCGHRRSTDTRGKYAFCTDEGRAAVMHEEAKLWARSGGQTDG